MTRDQILALLVDWAAQHEAIEGVHDALTELTGATPESPLVGALWGTFTRYSEALEARILGSAEFGWLEYFHLECDMGANAMDAYVGAVTYTLDGIEALASLMAGVLADKAAAPVAKTPAASARNEEARAVESPLQFLQEVRAGELPELLFEGSPLAGLTTDWHAAYCEWCDTRGLVPVGLKRFVSTIEAAEGIASQRKRWLDASGAVAGPNCMFLWGMRRPSDGPDQTVWLGAHVRSLRLAVDRYATKTAREPAPC